MWKFVSEARGSDGAGHRVAAVQLQCHYAHRVIVSYFKPVASEGEKLRTKVRIIAGELRVEFPQAGSVSRFEFLDPGGLNERLQVSVPLSFVDSAAQISKIRIEEIEVGRDNGAMRILELSTVGLQRIWTKVRPRCSVGA
jgi:hypothetical protein